MLNVCDSELGAGEEETDATLPFVRWRCVISMLLTTETTAEGHLIHNIELEGAADLMGTVVVTLMAIFHERRMFFDLHRQTVSPHLWL